MQATSSRARRSLVFVRVWLLVLALTQVACVNEIKSVSATGAAPAEDVGAVVFNSVEYTYWSFLCDEATAESQIELTVFDDTKPAPLNVVAGQRAVDGMTLTFSTAGLPQGLRPYRAQASRFFTFFVCAPGDPSCKEQDVDVPIGPDDGGDGVPPPDDTCPTCHPQVALADFDGRPGTDGRDGTDDPDGPARGDPNPREEASRSGSPGRPGRSLRNPSSAYEEDVVPLTGFLLRKELDTEIEAPGTNILLMRTYRSNHPLDANWFGRGWRSLYQRSVAFEVGGALLVETDGNATRYEYLRQQDGTYGRNPYTRAAVQVLPGGVEVRMPQGYRYVYELPLGRLNSITDPHGRTLELTYDVGTGAISTVRDAVGRVTSFETSTARRIDAIVLPNGDRWSYGYGASNELLSVVDPRGNATQYTYRPDGRLASRRGPETTETRWTYDGQNRVVTKTHEDGEISVFDYPAPRVFSATSTVQVARTLSVNVAGYVVAAAEPGGRGWSYNWLRGRLLQKTDPAGRTTSHTYDPITGELTSTTPPGGPTTSWTYDPGVPYAAVQTRTNGDGTSIQIQRDALGNILQYTDETGRTWSYTYNDLSLVLTETDPAGKTWTHGYDAQGNRILTVDPLLNSYAATYDALGRMTSRTDPLGRTTSYTYHQHHLVATVTDPAGQVLSVTYDGLNRPVLVQDVDGGLTRRTYRTLHGMRLLTSVTNPENETTLFEYDTEGKLIATVDPRGVRRSTSYDVFKQPVTEFDGLNFPTTRSYNLDRTLASVTDALLHVTSFGYDQRQRLTSVTNAENETTLRAYDARSRLTQVTAPDGAETKYTYDGAGRLTKIEDAQLGTRLFEYEVRGLRSKETDERGFETLYTYDELGRLKTVTDPLGGVTTRSYDGAGQLVAFTDQEDRTWLYEYDALGRRSKVTAPDGGETTYTYRATGELVSVTDPQAHTSTSSHDFMGRTTSSTDALGHVSQFQFDDSGRMILMLDENQNPTEFRYDDEDRLTMVIDASGAAVTHDYDPIGRRIRTTNSRAQVQTFAYDNVGRLIEKVLPGAEGTETATYDARGRRVESVNATVTETYAYDDLNRLVQKSDSRGFSVSYTRDPAGNITRIVDSRGRSATMAYDAQNRPIFLQSPSTGAYTFEYNKAHQETKRVYPNGEVTTRSYDPVGRLARIEHRETDAGTLLRAFDYEYDLAGNRTREVETRAEGASLETLYSYNARNELTRADVTTPGGAALKGYQLVEYTYDPAGNRLSRTLDGVTETYTYGSLNQITGKSGEPDPFVYDLDGNLLEEPLDGDLVRKYAYDSESNMIQTALQTVAGLEDVFRFLYSSDGLKVQSIEDPDTSDPLKLPRVAERFWSMGRVFEQAIHDQGATLEDAGWSFFLGMGEVLEEVAATVAGGVLTQTRTRLLVQDAVGSTVETADVARVQGFAQGGPPFFQEHVSTNANGDDTSQQGGGDPDVSFDGRFVSFTANTVGFLPGVQNHKSIVLKDRATGEVLQTIYSMAGGIPDRISNGGNTGRLGLSADGRYLSFVSNSTNLTPEGGDFIHNQIYRADIDGHQNVLVTRTPGGSISQGGFTGGSDISNDGARIAFVTQASDLLPSIPNIGAGTHLYLWDQGVLSLLDQAQEGTVANRGPIAPHISGDGQVAVWQTAATNLVSLPAGPLRDHILVRDLGTGTIEVADVSSTGEVGNGNASYNQVCGGGRFVVFTSSANNLVPGDVNGVADVFVRDRVLGVTSLASVGSDGTQTNYGFGPRLPSISQNGRFVAFVSGDTIISDTPDTDGKEDVFIHDRLSGTTIRFDLPGNGVGTCFISPDGRYVIFDGVLDGTPGNAFRVTAIRNPLSPDPSGWDLAQRQEVAYTPFGERKSGPSDLFVGFQALVQEALGDSSPDQLLSAQFRHARPGLGRWTSRDPGGFIDGPNRYRWLRNNPLAWADANGRMPMPHVPGMPQGNPWIPPPDFGPGGQPQPHQAPGPTPGQQPVQAPGPGGQQPTRYRFPGSAPGIFLGLPPSMGNGELYERGPNGLPDYSRPRLAPGPEGAVPRSAGREMSEYERARLSGELARKGWEKHRAEFPEFQTEEALAEFVEEMLRNPSETKDLDRGRTAYWRDDGTILIDSPDDEKSCGTVFRPGSDPRKIWDGLR